MKVYLDHAATSPIKAEVFHVMKPYLQNKFGNPSSIHSFGQEARKAVDDVREKVAKFFNCAPDEVIFTSGGTEANNLAIFGAIDRFGASLVQDSSLAATSRVAQTPHDRTIPIVSMQAPSSPGLKSRAAQCTLKGQLCSQKPHIITSKIEHHAILETCEYLEKQGLAEVTYIKVDKDGLIDPVNIKKAIKKNTALVTIMYANNEVGTIQPIREIGKIIKSENRNRLKEIRFSKPIYNFQFPISQIHFHTDAVQAAGYLSCDVLKLHVHLMTIAGHKIGAPKGVGALYIRKGTKIAPRTHGGAQEYGIRPGTENVAGIVGLGKAVELIDSLATASRSQVWALPARTKSFERPSLCSRRVARLRDKLAKGLLKIKDTKINGNLEKSVLHILNISFAGVEGESILLSLDQEGIAASTGSACTSQSLDPSHVIMAMYNDPVRAHSSVRFSLGEETSKDEIDYTIEKMKSIIKRLRSFSPTYKRISN